MKIAVLGAAGQLGRDLCPRLAALGEVVPLSRAEIDLARPGTIAPAIADLRPDIFVNCAAYNLVDKAETEPEAAFAVNTWGVRELATACRTANAKLVHFSTDYVFGLDAARTAPLNEDASPGPVSVYGLSKLTGEFVVRAAAPGNLVIRTCGLYGVWGSGGKGGNFVETMLRIAKQGKPLRVVNDQYCTPSYTADVADATVQLLERNATGLFHVTNSGACTWYQLAAEIFRQSGLHADLTPITSAEFGARAQRPPYSELSTAKLTAHGIPTPRPWSEALAAYLNERQARNS
ncbi:dTDP-4-dehydrorhamnose reductase OS=uncultured planctomycete GN=HGMM_F01A04C04 PE=4 SV=1: RmlD_sub_bind [Gemmata massiliana]|uniref:dTDP-4-dehydrorhamnose reductase n=1 Tax=Gemmata massiliana TaxID=1210884 RepID=A0A6P2CWM2_9BACT|nr:dTDP-4-dehydrorhamnose reductase [Gemmata massiliana]VTR93538.1 dTDP-4-dehydrorhamnose reductase OS=uncultured planctomycete GN=HGMM_F01A04C04 PE=4 SV=1: RmlD_sub_bind [Gemmata massiliana]